jgi:hypothetical protein
MKKYLVVEDKRTDPSAGSLVFCAETGHWVLYQPTEYPEYCVCISFDSNPYVTPYRGPIAFYRPEEDAPYLIITSPKTIDEYDDSEALTPEQMAEIFGSEVVQLNPYANRLAI